MSEIAFHIFSSAAWLLTGFLIAMALNSHMHVRALNRLGMWSKYQSTTWRSDPNGATRESLDAYGNTLAYTSGWLDGNEGRNPSDLYAYRPRKDSVPPKS